MYSILGALHEHGPQYVIDLCQILRCGPGTVYPELTHLENDGLVVGDWESRGDDRPRRRIYRLTTAEERSNHRRRQRARVVEPKPVPRRRLLWGAAWQSGDAS